MITNPLVTPNQYPFLIQVGKVDIYTSNLNKVFEIFVVDLSQFSNITAVLFYSISSFSAFSFHFCHSDRPMSFLGCL